MAQGGGEGKEIARDPGQPAVAIGAAPQLRLAPLLDLGELFDGRLPLGQQRHGRPETPEHALLEGRDEPIGPVGPRAAVTRAGGGSL